jgi:hypothetical protein
MKVAIKSFDVGMDIKNNGIELEVKDTSGKQLGDLIITKTQVIWCSGKTTRANGISVKWQDFIQLMQSPQSN